MCTYYIHRGLPCLRDEGVRLSQPQQGSLNSMMAAVDSGALKANKLDILPDA